MKISSTMDLDQLSERMGGDPPLESVETMRDLLVDRFDGAEVGDVPEAEWLRMLDASAAL